MATAAAHENMSYMYRFNMGLRGFHVYKAIWDPYVDEEISFEAENDNAYDDFAIAGYAGVTKVGHVPRELSRYFHFAIQHGAIISAKVISAQYRPSPLLQGGLEIPLEVTIRMDEERNIEIFRSRVREVKYRLDTPYIDESKTILNQILPSKFHADADIDIDDNDEINIDVDDEFLAMDVNPEDDVDGFDDIQDVFDVHDDDADDDDGDDDDDDEDDEDDAGDDDNDDGYDDDEDIEDIENGEVSNLSDLSDAEEIIRTKGNRRVKIVISDSDDDED